MAQAVPQTGRMSTEAAADQRKVRLLRSSLTVLLLGLGLVVVLIFLRNTYRKEQHLAEFETCRAWLQTQIDDLGTLPAKLSGRGGQTAAEFSPNLYLYVDDATRFYAGQTAEPVILVQSPMVYQWFATSGRAVIVRQAGQLQVEWVTEAEYQRRRADQEARVRAALNPPPKTGL